MQFQLRASCDATSESSIPQRVGFHGAHGDCTDRVGAPPGIPYGGAAASSNAASYSARLRRFDSTAYAHVCRLQRAHAKSHLFRRRHAPCRPKPARPINAFHRGDHYVFALTYGSNVDWVNNGVAGGMCQMRTGGRDVGPEVIVDPRLRAMNASTGVT